MDRLLEGGDSDEEEKESITKLTNSPGNTNNILNNS